MASHCNIDGKIVSSQNKIEVFESIIQSSPNTVVAFFINEQCPHCQKIKPIFSSYRSKCVQGEVNNTIALVNDRTAPELFTYYNVSSVPQILVFKNGREVNRIRGANIQEVTKFLTEA